MIGSESPEFLGGYVMLEMEMKSLLLLFESYALPMPALTPDVLDFLTYCSFS